MGLIDYFVKGITYEQAPEKRKKKGKKDVISPENVAYVQRPSGEVSPISQMEANAYGIEKWGKRYLAYAGAMVYEPSSFADIKCLLDHIFSNEKLIIDITKLEDFSGQRVVDYIAGACYVLNTNLSVVKESVFYCAPKI